MAGWRKVLMGLLGVGLLVAWAGQGAPAQAQAAPTLDKLQVEVWPEFDRPSALVLIHGVLPATTPLPATVSLRIPATGQLNATAYQDADQKLLMATNTVSAEGEWQRVTFSVPALNFRVEYYDPGLTMADQARTFAFNWISDYAVAAVEARVQEPVDARDLQVDPPFALAGTLDLGLNYYTRDYGAVAAGAPIAFTLKYTKPTATLSQSVVSQTAVTESIGLDTSSPIQGSQDLTPWLIGLGIVGGLALIGGAGWYFWPRGGAARSTPRPRRRARSAPADPAGGAGPAGANQFCTQCGQALTPADRFCRNCGTPVRD